MPNKCIFNVKADGKLSYLSESKDISVFCADREKKLAKKYYDKLFKEYCLGDLSRYKENKVGGIGKNANVCRRFC